MAKTFIENFNQSRSEKVSHEDAFSGQPEDTLRNQEFVAHSVESRSEALQQGIVYTQESIVLDSGGAFTNRYAVHVSAGCGIFEARTTPTPVHIQRQLRNDESACAAINGGFFFLADEASRRPKEAALGTIVRDGVVHGLQTKHRPLLYTDSAGLHVRDIHPRGIIRTQQEEYPWVGAGETAHEQNVLRLYNSSNCRIYHRLCADGTTVRTLDDEASRTPENESVCTAICETIGGTTRIVRIANGGGVSVLEGNFLLQGDKSLFSTLREGDAVCPHTLDGLLLECMHSAMTIGSAVEDFGTLGSHQSDVDSSLGDHAPFRNSRMARSVVYQTSDGSIHLEVFDGAPKTANFCGLTPHEVFLQVYADERNVAWAYHLDPGQSARMAIRHADGRVAGYGNAHYVRLPRKSGHPYVWAGEHGRAVASALIVHR